MSYLQDLSIRRKLKLITMLVTTTALLLACTAVFVNEYRVARRSLSDEMSAFAEIISYNSTAAISFNDPDAATLILQSLKGERELETAVVYAEKGRVLASYARSPGLSVPTTLPAAGTLFSSNHLEVVRRVMLDGRAIGTVYVRCDLSDVRRRMIMCSLILAVALAGALAVAYVLASWFQRLISAPILHLTDVARTVSTAKNYKIRAKAHGADELGCLIGCFNEMLDQIQRQDAELRRHHERLEEQVLARTVELKRTNDDLSAAMLKAEAANRAKSEFLANMSHEIRTPMTAILGYADLMLDPHKTVSDRVDCLQVVRRNARHLLELINDVLDISKIEAEKMTVERIPCDLPQLVVDAASMLRPKAASKGLTLDVEFAGPIPREIRTDPVRLKQVLMNLVGNAVKFTESGAVKVSVSAGSDGDREWVGFDVVDSGIGVAPDQLARLFQPFMQADGSMTRRFGGTGLGLAISKRLVTLLGGDIRVASEPGKGSTFSVQIDPGPTDPSSWITGLTEAAFAIVHEPVTSERVVLRGRVLLAEDGFDNQQLISLHLRTAGAEVVVADNGQVAVDLLRTQQFDVVLMDMQMPVLDGYGAASALRAKGYAKPIIALTAHAMTGDREKCIAAGCTDYLTKPIDQVALLRTVAKYLEAQRLPAATVAPIPPAAPPVPATVRASPAGAGPEFQAVVEGFIARLPARVDSLQRLLAERNLEELRRLVHQLKGAGSGYGFPQITEYARNTEQALKAEPKIEEIAGGVAELVDLIRRVDGYRQEKEAYAKA